MSPAFGSTIDSISFKVAASLPVFNIDHQGPLGTAGSQPPAPLLLSSGTTKTAAAQLTGPDCISPLPTMLLHLLKTWLKDKDSLPLILTSHHFKDEVQHYYRLRLRPAVARHVKSPIAANQNSVNLKPSLIGLGDAGEVMFQKCLAMQPLCQSEADYCGKVIQLLKLQVFEQSDVISVRDFYAGAVLGLGGTLMSQTSRDALLGTILGSSKSSSAEQMGAMIMGVCLGLHRIAPELRHHKAVFAHILASSKTSTPDQMGAMVGSMCRVFGDENMSTRTRTRLVGHILVTRKSNNRTQISAMLHHVCLALGGRIMKPEHRDGFIKQILTMVGADQRMPLSDVIKGLCRGLGGKNMTDLSLDALLSAIVGCHASWETRIMAKAVALVCIELGGPDISADRRDLVLAVIMGSHVTCSPDAMGRMVWGLCHSLGSMNQLVTDIFPDNLEAILSQVMQLQGPMSDFLTGAMIYYIYAALGRTDITPTHRAILLKNLRDSTRLHEIVEVLKVFTDGQALVDFLQLEGA